MSKYLPFFVYGTLIPGQPGDGFWADNIATIADAALSGGILYSLGEFPMVIESHPHNTTINGGSMPISTNGDQPQIKGKLISVHRDAYSQIMARLDMYEGFDPQNEGNSIYLRRERMVTTADGKAELAWAYIGKITYTIDRPIVPGGDWISYIQSVNMR